MPKLIPEDERPLYTSVFSALGAFIGGFSPLFWGLWLRNPDGGTSLLGYEVFFGFVVLGCVVVWAVLKRIEEPDVVVRPMLRGGANLRIFRFFTYLMNPVLRKNDGDEPKSKDF